MVLGVVGKLLSGLISREGDYEEEGEATSGDVSASNIEKGQNGHEIENGFAAGKDSTQPAAAVGQSEIGAVPLVEGSGLFRGLINDFRGRLPYYVSDWEDGFALGHRIFAPATYIFFASVVPALTFGQQLYELTDGKLNVVHVLMSTAISGTFQALIGGQPLVIYGVAQPVILIYGFMHTYAKDNDIAFMPWVTLTLVYTALMHFFIAAVNWCDFVSRFTRCSGEIFGLLIAGLFLQQAVKGSVDEFAIHHHELATSYDVTCSSSSIWSWRQVNGIFSICISIGLLLSSILLRRARSWRFFTSGTRNFLTDYGPPLMVVLWTLFSHATSDFPKDIPRRVSTQNLVDSQGGWSVLGELGDLSGSDWGTAVVPAFIITNLFYFDHNISTQLASVEEFKLKKPSAYHYDFFLLGFVTLLNGIIGLPPSNGAIPQAPMHTRSLRLRPALPSQQSKSVADVVAVKSESSSLAPELEVVENRLSGLIQSILCLLCIFLVPVIKEIPTAALWGYFALMAYESLPGNELFFRATLFFTDPAQRLEVLGPKFRRVKYKTIVQFTILQILLLGCVWGVTQAGIAGVSFPLFIMALIPIRENVLTFFFTEQQLAVIDSKQGVD